MRRLVSREGSRRVWLGVLSGFALAVPIVTQAARADSSPPVAYCASEALDDGEYFIQDSVALEDGSLIAVGTTGESLVAGNQTAGFIAKFTSDGERDAAFGDAGVVRLDLGTLYDGVYAVVVDDVGRIVVGDTGWFGNAPTGLALRLEADGTVDTSFGDGGVTDLGFPIYDVAIGTRGRLLFAAPDVIALDDKGQIDPTFGVDGRAGTVPSFGRLGVQPDGRIVAVSGDLSAVHAYRFTPDGMADPVFGVGGITEVTLTEDHTVTDVVVTANGTVVIVGASRVESGWQSFLMRLLPSGEFDQELGNALAWYTPSAVAMGLVVFDDLSMAVATESIEQDVWGSVMRLDPNGQLDDTFAIDGVATIMATPWSLRARPDGALLASINMLPPRETAAIFAFDTNGDCVDTSPPPDTTIPDTYPPETSPPGTSPPETNPPGTVPDVPLPELASRFVAIEPTRILDSRTSTGPIAADTSIALAVTGHAGIPSSGVSAVVLNITATDTTSAGFVTVWPAGKPRPLASNLNIDTPGDTVAALVTSAIAANGTVAIYTQRSTDLVVDAVGYYTLTGATSAGRLVAVEPHRLLDTRIGPGTPGSAPPEPGRTIDIAATGADSPVPSDASAVIVNVTATEAAAPGYVTLWGPGDRPPTSNVNLARTGQTVANLAIVPVAGDGRIQAFTQSGTHLIVDVVGWFTGDNDPPAVSGLFVPMTPARYVDTRTTGTPTPVVTVDLSLHAYIQAGRAAAVAGTLTITNTRRPGYFAVFPGNTPSLASTVNAERAGHTVANHFVTAVSNGHFAVFAQHPADVIVDLTGWYIA